MTAFRCPHCQAVLESARPGATIPCPTCGQWLEVPGPQAEPNLPEAQLLDEPPARRRSASRAGRLRNPYRRRRRLEPHRGTLILVLGILSLVVAQVILGPIAWILGNEDLKKIRAGRMDPEGESPTNTGRICGMVGTALGAAALLAACIFFVFWLSLFNAIFAHAPRWH